MNVRSHERGQSLLEFAMVLPVLLLLTMGIIEFGRAYYQYNTLSKAVRQAARYMSIHEYSSTEQTNAKRMACHGNTTTTGTPCLPALTTSNFTVTGRGGGTTNTTPPAWIKVAASYNFQPLFPSILPSVPLSPAVEMRYVGENAPYATSTE